MSLDMFAELAAPFNADQVRWRQQGKPSGNGRVQLVAYINARDVMDRLDRVVGPAGWSSCLVPVPGGMSCALAVWCNGVWVSKSSAASNTDIEPVKGGASDALKRAAVCWGIGRYLYGLEMSWVSIVKGEWANGRGVDVREGGKHIGYAPFPKLPSWALPSSPPKAKKGEVRNTKEQREATDAASEAAQAGIVAEPDSPVSWVPKFLEHAKSKLGFDDLEEVERYRDFMGEPKRLMAMTRDEGAKVYAFFMSPAGLLSIEEYRSVLRGD